MATYKSGYRKKNSNNKFLSYIIVGFGVVIDGNTYTGTYLI